MMVDFKIEFARQPAGYLKSITKNQALFIMKNIRLLREDPRKADVTPLKGQSKKWRLREGKYRVIFLIDDRNNTIFVAKIGTRGDLYK